MTTALLAVFLAITPVHSQERAVSGPSSRAPVAEVIQRALFEAGGHDISCQIMQLPDPAFMALWDELVKNVRKNKQGDVYFFSAKVQRSLRKVCGPATRT